jgi:hypothetical protein
MNKNEQIEHTNNNHIEKKKKQMEILLTNNRWKKINVNMIITRTENIE